jgi:hypothetical protein
LRERTGQFCMAAESSTGRGAMPKTLIILAAALLSA